MKQYAPLLMMLCACVGIFIGRFSLGGSRMAIITQSSDKIAAILSEIDSKYVEEVDINEVVEKAIPDILSNLDPHSTYFPAQDANDVADELRGSFYGIGVQFRIQEDTIVVMSVIDGGPSKRVGLMPGDRIVRIDDNAYVGKEVVSDTGAIRRLKGPKNTNVKVGIKRNTMDDEIEFNITRGEIPVHSIDCAYMMPDIEVGYLHIKNFGETTYSEMMTALAQFQAAAMKGLIIDLRGNSGGYLQTAIAMCNEFLPANNLIVYTEGRAMPREDFRSDGHGSFRTLPIVVLIDELSASASEIFAGAMQDNDRATIIGRRSFGKGLVQQPVEFSDGSMMRLTVARYYTPSGRCIQKPYTSHDKDYENDLLERYERGEFFSQDSIHQDGPEYQTVGGRVVYGGGGIMPDIFVPEDTTLMTSYYREAVNRGLFVMFAFQYTDERRSTLGEMETADDIVRYLRRDRVIDKFAVFAEKHGVQRRNLMIQRSRPLFEKYLYGAIIYDVLDIAAYQQYLNLTDSTIKRALEELGTNHQLSFFKSGYTINYSGLRHYQSA